MAIEFLVSVSRPICRDLATSDCPTENHASGNPPGQEERQSGSGETATRSRSRPTSQASTFGAIPNGMDQESAALTAYTVSAQCRRSRLVTGGRTGSAAVARARIEAISSTGSISAVGRIATRAGAGTSTTGFATTPSFVRLFPQPQPSVSPPGVQGFESGWLSSWSCPPWQAACSSCPWSDSACECPTTTGELCDGQHFPSERRLQQQSGIDTTKRRVTSSRNGPVGPNTPRRIPLSSVGFHQGRDQDRSGGANPSVATPRVGPKMKPP